MARALLEPVTAGQTRFRLQGLSPDARGIAVGREAVMVFDSLDRLVSFLGAFSREASLDDLLPSLTIERAARRGGGHGILVRCTASDGYALDRLGRLVGATRSQLYIGGSSVFVHPRERRAPFGYDLAVSPTDLGRVSGEELVVVDPEFATIYSVVERLDPVELILRLAPRSVPIPASLAYDLDAVGLRDMALLLIAPGIADRVLSYLWHTEVPMAGIRVQIEEDRQSSLLLRLRQPSGRVLDILKGIPGVEILAPVSPRAAIQLGFEHPIHLASAGQSLPGDDMYIFRGGVGRVERIDGAPRFVDGVHLVRTEVEVRDWDPGQLRPGDLDALRVDLRLRRTSQAREPRATLVAWSDIQLLRRLVYVVPPSALAAARVIPLNEGILILSGTSRISHDRSLAVGTIIPLGTRLVEVAPGVLVPDGFEMWPRVRPALIRELLGLEGDDRALFIGPGHEPLHLPESEMLPLDTAVIGRLDPVDLERVEPAMPALEAGRIENRRLGRFALWGFRASDAD
jgi:hypothetical protein